MFGLQASGFSQSELERFKHFQRISYGVLETVAASLQTGETEKVVTRRIHRAMTAAGAQNYFHVPVALFGERTAYPGAFGQFEALPTERVLQPGDAVILDAAPIFDGYTVDTSYASRFGSGGVPRELDQALLQFRGDILARANAGLTMREIARQIDGDIKLRGLENCHRKHIGMVLGHRVTREKSAFLRGRAIWGLAPRQVGWFVINSMRSARGKPILSPNWNHTRQSDCPVPNGLWAVEPHIARDGFGAKFEEILVVQDGKAFYLDEALPHTRRWAAAGLN